MRFVLSILFHASLFGGIVNQRKSVTKDLAIFFFAFYFYPLKK